MVRFLILLIWASGGIGWNYAGSEDNDFFTPAATIWPLIAANYIGQDLYKRSLNR